MCICKKPKRLLVKLSDSGKEVEISADVPVKGVAVECENDKVIFEDNLVDVVPGEMVRIGVKGAVKETVLRPRYLGMI